MDFCVLRHLPHWWSRSSQNCLAWGKEGGLGVGHAISSAPPLALPCLQVQPTGEPLHSVWQWAEPTPWRRQHRPGKPSAGASSCDLCETPPVPRVRPNPLQGLCTHSSLMHISLPGNQRAGLQRSPAHDSHHSWHECGQREGPHPAPKCEPCTSLTPLPEGPTSYMTHSRGAGGGRLSLPNTQPLEHPPVQMHSF